MKLMLNDVPVEVIFTMCGEGALGNSWRRLNHQMTRIEMSWRMAHSRGDSINIVPLEAQRYRRLKDDSLLGKYCQACCVVLL